MGKDTGAEFRALHQRGNPFIMANAWDLGSAKVLVALGAQAIATSSAAHAFSVGRVDMGNLTRAEALGHAQDLLGAVQVPISGDFENGFGDAPDTCAQTVRLAGEIGLAGISIEDIKLPGTTPYGFDFAVERIRAAAAAARALPGDFILTARADGIMHGQYDIEEALRRVRGFEAAGADCIYVPAPANMADLARICRATSLPVNALIAGPYKNIKQPEFSAIGVGRISLGSSLARATHRVIYDAAKSMFEDGNFEGMLPSISGDIIDGLLSGD